MCRTVAALVLSVACLVLLRPGEDVAAAEASASCVAAGCVTQTVCTVLDGSGPTGCSINNGVCSEEFGICVRTQAHGLGIPLEALLEFDGNILAPVAEDVFAAWDCEGTLIRLARRTAGGVLVEMDVTISRDQFEYVRVLEDRAREA